MEEILIQNQENIVIKGAKKVVSSVSTQCIIQTASTIIFSGNAIEIKKLDLENEEVILCGKINNIKFLDKANKQPLLKRIFK